MIKTLNWRVINIYTNRTDGLVESEKLINPH